MDSKDMEKRQWIEVTRGGRIIALYSVLLDLLEELSEESGIPPWEFLLSEKVLDLSNAEPGDYLVSYSPGVSSVKSKSIIINNYKYNIILEPGNVDMGVSPIDLYEGVPHIVLREDSTIWKKLAFETTMSGIEYMGIYLDDGRVLFVEGEVFRVKLPFIRALASIHTHPEPHCLLSLKDVESGLDLLVEGGLFEAAATQSCAHIMYRIGLVNEDDYIALREFIVSKGKEFSVLSKLSTVKFSRVGY